MFTFVIIHPDGQTSSGAGETYKATMRSLKRKVLEDDPGKGARFFIANPSKQHGPVEFTFAQVMDEPK